MTTIQTPLAAAFDAGFGGATTRPGEAGYDRARGLWNGTIDRHPALIAHCGNTADVVAAVNLTRAAGVPLAVRGGGHSLPGFSSCDDGVVVDLSGMHEVTG
jgi:FAD/FMN-containing dehydrogenase